MISNVANRHSVTFTHSAHFFTTCLKYTDFVANPYEGMSCKVKPKSLGHFANVKCYQYTLKNVGQ